MKIQKTFYYCVAVGISNLCAHNLFACDYSDPEESDFSPPASYLRSDDLDDIVVELKSVYLSDVKKFEKATGITDIMVESHVGIDNVHDVQQQIESLKSSIPTSSLCVIYDVDGTVTECGYPTAGVTAKPRGAIVDDIQWFKENNIRYVFSSAWNFFSETLDRLAQVNLQDASDAPIISGKLQIDDVDFHFCQKDNAASVKLLTFSDGRYWRQKAYSPLVVYPENYKEIEVLLFVEDTKLNIEIFLKNLKETNPYPNLKRVITYLLNPVSSPVGS